MPPMTSRRTIALPQEMVGPGDYVICKIGDSVCAFSGRYLDRFDVIRDPHRRDFFRVLFGNSLFYDSQGGSELYLPPSVRGDIRPGDEVEVAGDSDLIIIRKATDSA